jgi:hypothetical protein
MQSPEFKLQSHQKKKKKKPILTSKTDVVVHVTPKLGRSWFPGQSGRYSETWLKNKNLAYSCLDIILRIFHLYNQAHSLWKQNKTLPLFSSIPTLGLQISEKLQ